MGLIRGVLFVFFSVLFFIALLTTGILLTLSSSLENQNIKTNLANLVSEQINQNYGGFETIQNNLSFIQSYCQNNTDYVFQEAGEVFVISCDVASQGQQAVINNTVSNFIDRSYYKEYSCGFWDCFKQGEIPFFLASKQAYDYWNNKFYFAMLASLILLGLVFLFTHDKTNVPFIVGAFMIIVSLVVLKINALFFIFGGSISQFIGVFFSQSYPVFLKFLFFGIGIILLGLVLKMFKAGFKFSNFMEKVKLRRNSLSKNELKEFVKKEIAKSKDEKKIDRKK
ncbi:MAG: hypothetical protein AABW51_04080 [Nanoarchaeota archaeon]